LGIFSKFQNGVVRKLVNHTIFSLNQIPKMVTLKVTIKVDQVAFTCGMHDLYFFRDLKQKFIQALAFCFINICQCAKLYHHSHLHFYTTTKFISQVFNVFILIAIFVSSLGGPLQYIEA